MLQAGQILGERFRLIERLGEGGMGSVWIAENVSLKGSEVALKVMHTAYGQDETMVQRFRAEAEAAVRVGHPGIVKVFEFGELEDGAPFIVMERLRGESLADRLERGGALAPREAVVLLRPVLDALAAAHEKDILHRDLKPENIFLENDGATVRPKILDFGVSKILGGDAERVRLTRTGALIGTPAYMAPEQAMGEEAVDIRVDLWAMGVILYELVAGRLPYEGANYNAVLAQILTARPCPITDHVPTLDPGLVTIIERAMARNPRQRFASARAMDEALATWLRGDGAARSLHPPPRNPTPVRPTPMAFEAADTLPDASLPERPKPRPRPWMVAAALLGAGVLALVALRAPKPAPSHAAVPAMAPVSVARPVRLSIENLPAGAHVSVDDAPVMLPASLRPGAVHRVRVEAPGYQAWGQEVETRETDVALRYAGLAVAAQPASPPPAPPAPLANDPGYVRRRTVTRAATGRVHRRDPRRVPNGAGLANDPGF